ncbi:MAG: mannosyltransferase [Polaribacter sp.]|uniref:mannosyltransferase n=1 Tax=Polaribacter sp. TaxID=1920175 RepID=UPI003BAE2CF2
MFFFRKQKVTLLVLTSIILYFLFGYFLERTAFYKLLFLWSALFGCFYFLINNKKISFSNLVGISILFRLIFLFTTPNLSQDFYRFIWDGRMILEGLNPYLSYPEYFMQQRIYPIAEASELYLGMGELNGSHYSNYPPLNQLCFLIAAIFSSKSIFGSIIVLRSIIILADIGILYFGSKLLQKLNLPKRNIFWYILNPFIIIEMTGNLHFESVMLFFFIVGMYKLHQQKWILAAIFIGLSISLKLLPLLFLPLFFKWFVKNRDLDLEFIQCKKNVVNLEKNIPAFMGISKLIAFYAIILSTITLLFLPFYSSELLENYTKSIALWFGKFEFNASFYYIFREIGYVFRGYNEIAIIGKITAISTILFLIILTFFRKNTSFKQLFTAMLFGLCFYYFTATTLHPWYIATPLLLSVFTKYKFPILWSLVVILSYQVYANELWKENPFILIIEYLLVFGFLIYELKNKSSKNNNLII